MKNLLAFYWFTFLTAIALSFIPALANNPEFLLLAPTLLSPLNFEENVPENSVLTWSESPNTNKYRVEVASDSNFININHSAIVANKYLKFKTPTFGSSYYWRVKAYNSVDSSEYSTVFAFRTIDTTGGNDRLHCRKANIFSNYPSQTYGLLHNEFFDKYSNLIMAGQYKKELYLTPDIRFTDKYYDAQYRRNSSYIAIFDSLGLYKYGLNFSGSSLTLASAVTDRDGNTYLAGSFSSAYLRFSDSIYFSQHYSPSPNGNYIDGFIAKINKFGKCEWAQCVGGNDGDCIYKINLDKNSNIWVLGFTASNVTDFGNNVIISNHAAYCFLAKYDNNGKCQFAKDLGNVSRFEIDNNDNFVFAGGLYQNQDTINVLGNKIYLVGDTAQKGFVVKLDSKFNLIWSKRINLYIQSDYWEPKTSINININSKNDILVDACYNNNSKEDGFNLNFAGGYYDTYIALLDSNGKHKWIRSFSTAGNELITCTRFDKYDNIYLTCNFNSDILFLNDTKFVQKNNILYTNQFDAFIASFDTNANLISYSLKTNLFSTLSVDGSGRVLAFGGGDRKQNIDFGDNVKFNQTLNQYGFWVEYGSRIVPEIPILKFPNDSLETVSKDFAISWFYASNANKYYYSIAKDDKFQSIILAGNCESEYLPVEHEFVPGVYYWKVRAKNELGYSEWSEIRSFRIIENNQTETLNCLAKKYFSQDSLSNIRMAYDDFGNYYFAGYYNVPELKLSDSISLKKTQTWSYFFTKYNKAGICQWAKNVEGNIGCSINDLKVNDDGEVFIAGDFKDSLLVAGVPLISTEKAGFTNFFAKFDSLGTNIYAKQYLAGSMNSLSLTPDPLGNLYITGYFDWQEITFAPGYSLINKIKVPGYLTISSYIAKFDKSGNCFGCALVSNDSYIPCPKIMFDKVGNKIVVGTFNTGNYVVDSQVQLKKNPNDSEVLYIIKYDPNGYHLWHKTISSNDYFLSYNFDLSRNGDVNLIGVSSPSRIITIDSTHKLQAGNDYSIFAIKYDSLGNCIKTKFIANANLINFDGPPSHLLTADIGVGLKITENDDFYLTGMFANCSLDFGNNKSLYPGKLFDIYLAKFDSSFTCRSSKAIRGVQNEQLCDVFVDYDKNVYMLGTSDSPFINLSGTNNIINQQPGGFSFWAKFGLQRNLECPTLVSPNHNKTLTETRPKFVWNRVNLAKSYEIEVSSDSKFYNIVELAKCGDTTLISDKDFAKNTIYFWRVRATNDKDTSERSAVHAFYIKDDSGVAELENNAALIYPNPTTGILKYEISAQNENLLSIRVTDFLGQNVLYNNNPNHQSSGEIDLSAMASGNYSIIFETTRRIVASKFVVQK